MPSGWEGNRGSIAAVAVPVCLTDLNGLSTCGLTAYKERKNEHSAYTF